MTYAFEAGDMRDAPQRGRLVGGRLWRSRARASALALALALAFTGPAMAKAPIVPPVATDEPEAVRNLRVIPPPSTRSHEIEEANKRIVMQWHYEFFDLGHYDEAAAKYMDPNFTQHDLRDPQGGSAAMVKGFKTNGYVPMKPAARPAFKAVLGDGDLVMIVFDAKVPWPGGPQKEYPYISCDLFRVRDGKITDMWYSGMATPPDKLMRGAD